VGTVITAAEAMATTTIEDTTPWKIISRDENPFDEKRVNAKKRNETEKWNATKTSPGEEKYQEKGTVRVNAV